MKRLGHRYIKDKTLIKLIFIMSIIVKEFSARDNPKKKPNGMQCSILLYFVVYKADSIKYEIKIIITLGII